MIKKLSLISLFTLLPASYYYAQTTVYAYVKDAQGAAVENASVDLKGASNEVNSDKIGYFQFVDLKPGHYQIIVSKPNFEAKTIDFDINDEKRKDLGTIKILSSFSNADMGIAVVDNDNSDDDNNTTTQSSTVGLLQSSRDIFSSIAGYDLGFYWFRPRGIDGRTGVNMLNGISMSEADSGNTDFGNWGGLNEIMKYPETAVNHAPSEYAFGGIGSVVYKNTNAAEYRKGSSLTYSLTNRNYNNRLSYRYSSGMNKKGWAFTGMVARRWAQEGIQDGTYYDGWGTYLGVEKKINDRHTIAFNYMGSPYKRAGSSPNTQEVYDLRGIHYNAYWGWQDGRKRNERQKSGYQPILQVSDYLKLGKSSNLWTTVSYQFGKDHSTRLDRFNALNPSPTYYKNLPSYFLAKDVLTINEAADFINIQKAWQNDDQSVTRLNWNNLYQANFMHNASSDKDAGRAVYWLADDIKDDKIWNASTHFTHDFSDATKFILNVSYQNYKSEQYREVSDLLGAKYVANYDSYSKDLDNKSSYNTLDPNTSKGLGEKINYDYIFRRQEVKVNPGVKFTAGNFDVFASAQLSYINNNREGLFKHYLYPNSYGKSVDRNFWDVGIKGQVTYRINGRNFLVYNGAAYTQAPYLDEVFANARVSNAAASNKSMFVNANDLSYVINTPTVKLRLSGFLINTENETNVQRFFADVNSGKGGQDAFVTQVMTGVDKRNMGVELGVQVKLTPTLTASGLANYGQYTYTNNPHLRFLADNPLFLGQSLAIEDYSTYSKDMGTTYLKNYKQGGTPQEAYTLGLRYSNPKYWWVGASWNYLGNSYLDPSPGVRTESFITSPVGGVYPGVTPEELDRVLVQNKLPSAFFFNLNAGKSWMIGKYYVMISGTLNNILGNKHYITGGFEQTRNTTYSDFQPDFDSGHMNFAPKYWYSQGRSYFVNVQFRF